MKFRYYNLIISLSFLFFVSDLFAADLSTSTIATVPSDQKNTLDLQTLNHKIELLESKLSQKDTELQLIKSRYSDIEQKYTDLLKDSVKRMEEDQIKKATVAVKPVENEKVKTGADKILDNSAVKDYLSEYYVDINVDDPVVTETSEKELMSESKSSSLESQNTSPAETKIVIEQRLSGSEEKVKEIVRYVDESMKGKDGFQINEDDDKSTKKKIQKAQKELFKAQRLFYAKSYSSALNSVTRSLSYYETPIAYALEGSIYLTMGDLTSALSSWRIALEQDPDMYEVRDALQRYSNSY